MREVEAWCYIDAIEEIKRLEKESLDVREYLRNLRLLKTIDSQALKTLEKVASEENFQEILQITGKTMREEKQISFYPSATKKNYKERREVIVLTAPIIKEFDRVASNGSSSMEKGANLWDYRGEEVILELKYSVARLSSIDGIFLFSVSGRPNFCEKIARLIDENGEFETYKKENETQEQDSDYPEFYQEEIIKIHRRVPGWLRKTYQNNSKILIAFIKISHYDTIPVYPSVLERNCDLDTATFYNNFNDMKGMHKNGHGKVFDTRADGTIELWEPVADFIIQEYKKVFD